MKTFIFKNNTIDYFFDKDSIFSGYEDISCIPDDFDRYVWFYQAPVGLVTENLVNKVKNYINMVDYIITQINSNKQVVIFTLKSIYNYKIISNNYDFETAIDLFNKHILDLSTKNRNIKVINFESFLEQYKKTELIDWRFYYTAQIPLNPNLVGDFKTWYKRKIDEIEYKRKKCIVLDLDNTLWGGVLGEDGINGIKIGGDYPGKSFLHFQEELLELSKKGVILAVCSKNNEEDVIECWNKNPYNLINDTHISAKRINWNNKADNIKEIAAELNIGLDSFVFIDDNPTERELVKDSLPMVECPEFPKQPYMLNDFMSKIICEYFSTYEITNEDLAKTEAYKSNVARNQEKLKFTDLNSFIKNLNITIKISKVNESNKSRICQMIQKTNQFNLTSIRYIESDIDNLILQGAYIYCISVSDKFGDNGITGCIIIEDNEIKELLLSCRILGKNIEFAFINEILRMIKSAGIKKITASYIPSPKNSQVKEFYEHCGFCLEKNVENVKVYSKNLEEFLYIKDDKYNIIVEE